MLTNNYRENLGGFSAACQRLTSLMMFLALLLQFGAADLAAKSTIPTEGITLEESLDDETNCAGRQSLPAAYRHQ